MSSRARLTAPDRGDIVWLDFSPQAGHEQSGRRPAVVVSPVRYNAKVGLALVCPITSQAKGYPFEVALPQRAKVSGVMGDGSVVNARFEDNAAVTLTRSITASDTWSGQVEVATFNNIITTANLFELARRLPGATLTLTLLMLVRRHEVRTSTGSVTLPLPPERIAWVAAAGNYVELHGGERPLLVRAPLAAVEATLKPHGFVRIHRSTLVNRQRVARVRNVDLLLDDGRSLKLGPRFRAQLLG